MIINPYIFGGFDADALAFITAASITDTTQKSAIDTLVKSLKSANIWTKFKAIYPFVGGTASSHRFNLKAPTTNTSDFYLTFTGGWTHSSTGALPDGSSGYATTNLIPSTDLTGANFAHLSYYSRSNTLKSFEYVMGSNDTTGDLSLIGRRNTSLQYFSSTNTLASYIEAYNSTASTGLGFLLGTQQATTIKLFRSNVLQASNTTVTTGASLSTKKILIGAKNNNDSSYVGYTDKECAFASIGYGLTDSESTAFYNAVQTFQTTLGRQV